MRNLFSDRDGNLSSRILFITVNSVLTWIIIFMCVYRDIDIHHGVQNLLIVLTTKSGIDSVSQVYQNIKDGKKEEFNGK